MKLIETLSNQAIIELLNGNTVGIFPHIILSDDAYFDKIYEMCSGYYLHRSGEKRISPSYERVISLKTQHPSISGTPESILGSLIRGKFVEKWSKIYNALINTDYDPTKNISLKEEKTATNQNKDTHNTNKTKNGSNSDTTTFDTNVESNGKTGTHETTTRTLKVDNEVYGFNSASSVGDNNSFENVNETLSGDADRNISYNNQAKTGTESKVFGVNESEKYTGTDVTDIKINEKNIKDGRTESATSLIKNELDLRNKEIFFDIVYKDIDSILVISIY